MSVLRISRAESRRIDHQLAHEDAVYAEEIMNIAVLSYGSGRFGRLRIKAVPPLPSKTQDVEKSGDGWRYLFMLRILVDVMASIHDDSLIASVALSTLAFVPFVIKGGERGARGFWILTSFLHLIFDVLHAKWMSASLSVVVLLCCFRLTRN